MSACTAEPPRTVISVNGSAFDGWMGPLTTFWAGGNVATRTYRPGASTNRYVPFTPTLARPATSVGRTSAVTPGPAFAEVTWPSSTVTVAAAYLGSVEPGIPLHGATPPVTTATPPATGGEPVAVGGPPLGPQAAIVHNTSTESAAIRIAGLYPPPRPHHTSGRRVTAYSGGAVRTMPRASRVLALLGFVAIVTTFIAYTGLLEDQSTLPGQPTPGLFTSLSGAPTWFLAVLAATAAADAVAVWLPAGRPRRLLLVTAAIVLALVGFLAIFSVGLALLIAAGLTAAAAGQDGSARRPGHTVEGP